MLKLAHRGALAVRTENTLESFRQALSEGFDGIELDVQTCASGEVVVFHDENLLRLTGVNAMVAETTWTELEKLSVDGQKIPLLKAIIDKLQSTLLLIEIKDSQSAQAVEQLIATSPGKHVYIVGSQRIEALEALTDATKQIAFISDKWPFVPRRRISKYRLTHFVSHHWVTNWIGIYLAKRHRLTYFVYPVKSRLIHKIMQHHRVDGAVYDRYIDN